MTESQIPQGGLDAAIKELESLVDELESGELPLEEALGKFEAAVKLGAQCREYLAQAESRVRQILEKDGKTVEEPFDADANER